MTDVDPQHLARAKERLRSSAKDVPKVDAYCGVPIEAFDRDDLLLMLATVTDILVGEKVIQQ